MPLERADYIQAGQQEKTRITRNDSLRSERSDKRVSFNKDVGVKHIPRGPKEPTQNVVKLAKDEWSNCAPIHLEKSVLSSQELEEQAEDLVRLLDQVDCVSAQKPITNPAYTSRSLDRTKKKDKVNINNKLNNNSKPLNNTEKEYILFNGLSDISLSRNETTNLIKKKNKENVNIFRHHSNNLKNQELALPYEKFGIAYKSVPDISNTIYYDSTPRPTNNKYSFLIGKNVENSKNFMSVDNLSKNWEKNCSTPRNYKNNNRNVHKSADNLPDISIPGARKLQEYKPCEDLRSANSSSLSLKMDHESGNNFRPKVSNMIRRLNSDNMEPRVRTHPIYLDDSSPRNYKDPNSYYNQSNNKALNYTSPLLSSVEELRRISPSREIPSIKNVREINRYDGRDRSSSREYDRSSKNTDSDYSAKIIITGSNVHPRYDDDDHAYETYQVGGSPFTKHVTDYEMSAEDFRDDYKNILSNNINMSSIGVQTDKLPKAPQRSRRNPTSISPNRNERYRDHGIRQDLPSASLVRRINHGFGRVDRSPSPPPTKRYSHRTPRNVVPLLSDTDDSEFNYHKRMDPLAKIRHQVNIREKLQEEREAEESEEKENLFQRRHKSLIELNSSKMQPLTVDEIDALTLEVDKKGRNALIVAHDDNKNAGRTKSSDYHRSSKSETNIDQGESIPYRGRNLSPNDHGKNEQRSLSPRLFSTLERIRSGGSEKEKSTLERKTKDKKKKKIKIKFFYDPRPQDKLNVDPLDRYTEYKGGYMDDQEAPRLIKDYMNDDAEPYDDYYNEKEYHFRARDDIREKNKRYQRDSSESPSRREPSPSQPPRSTSREREKSNDQYRRDSSSERAPLKINNRQPRNIRLKGSDRSDYDSIERRGTTERKTNRKSSIKERYDHETRRHFSNAGNETRLTTSQPNEYDYGDNPNDSSDQGPPSLSGKYKSLTRRTFPVKDKRILKNNDETLSRNSTEEENRKEKMQRQRRKFFGVLLGEGKAKSSSPAVNVSAASPTPPLSGTKVISSTLPRESHTHSSTVQPLPPDDSLPIQVTMKAKDKSLNGRSYISRDREADNREKKQWESATLTRSDLSLRGKGMGVVPTKGVKNDRLRKDIKYSADSSPSSTATPTGRRAANYKHRYFGDTDTEVNRSKLNTATGGGNYRSLPNRKSRSHGSRQNLITRRTGGVRKASPGARGSAGSSLQSSESEADSHGGSHASRASYVSTGSNRSVYLHATAVADIPVRRSSDEAPSEKGISRQSKKVTRSFSLVSPWKPRHYREKYEVEYDNREVREAREGKNVKEEREGKKSALPPRPPRKIPDNDDNPKKVGRSQTVYKDSKLAGWLRRRKNKDVKGI